MAIPKSFIPDSPTGTLPPSFIPDEAPLSTSSATTPTPSPYAGVQNRILGSNETRNFIRGDILGTNIGQEPKGFVQSLAQSTIGSKGLAGVAQLPGRTIASFSASKEQERLGKQVQDLSDVVLQAFQRAKAMPFGPERDKAYQIATESNNHLMELNNQLQMLSKYTISPSQALGTTLNAALTAGTAGTGSLAEQGAKTAVEKFGGNLALNTVSNIGRAATSLPVRVAENAAIGAGTQIASNLNEGKPITEGVGIASAIGGAIPLGAAGISKTVSALRPELTSSVNKALGMTGKMSLTGAQEKAPKAIQALTTIADNAPNIKVIDDAGIEKVFEPTKATWPEMLQALKQTKDTIYAKYTDLAEQAGDAYARIGQKDFAEIFKAIDANIKNRTTPFRSKAMEIKDDLVRIFGDQRTGGKQMRYIKPTDLQGFLEDLNTEVQADPRSPAAKVAAEVSQKIREVMDANITGATGQQYQELRTQYANLKSIENDIINQFKKAARKTSTGISGWIEGYGGLDALASIARGDVIGAARGAGFNVLARIKRHLSDPETYLQSSFKQIGALSQEPANLLNSTPVLKNLYERVTGGKTYTPETPIVPKLGLSIEDVSKKAGAVYQGEADLTLKTLEKLKGRSTVSKQFISDLTNAPDLKQAERDAIRTALAGEGSTVNVGDFAKKVKAELLPLKVNKARDMYSTARGGTGGRYENIVLPDDLRGNVKNYEERIYESPIKTSAGQVHFGQPKDKVENYFGHTRVEDMADNKTRRVIEVQSDLYQKGNLEKEGMVKLTGLTPEQHSVMNKLKTIEEKNAYIKSIQGNLKDKVAKLQQYNDPTAHFRMIREEIKKAAQDGKTKLQFPTGETAMKIEGLGDNTIWQFNGNENLNRSNLAVGLEVRQGANIASPRWIITDVLGDGKFKAVPKDIYEENGGQMLRGVEETFDISGKVDQNNPIYKFYEKEVGKYLGNKFGAKRITDAQGVSWWEVPLSKEQAKQPVLAFGKTKVGTALAGAGASALAVGANASKTPKKINKHGKKLKFML